MEDSESVKVLEKEVKRLEESLKEVREFNKNLGSINQSYRRSIKTSKEELDEYKGTTLIDVERIIQEAIDDPKIDSKELSDIVKNLFETMDTMLNYISISLGISVGVNNVDEFTFFLKKLTNDIDDKGGLINYLVEYKKMRRG